MKRQNRGAGRLQLDPFGTRATPDQQKEDGENQQQDRDPEEEAAHFFRVKRWHGSAPACGWDAEAARKRANEAFSI